MAVHNDPMLYRGGAVTFNSQPEVGLYAQLLQRKQAKDDAIDEYYRKLPMTVNKAGMRDQEAAILDQKLADWQKHWMENKDKVRKGNSQEAFDSDKKFRELQFFVQESKNRAKTDLELGKMRFSKDNEYIFQDPDFLEAQHAHSLPIGTEGSKEIDLGTIAVPPKPLDTDRQNKLWNAATNGVKAMGKEYDETKQTKNPVTGLVAVPYVKKFKPDQVVGIAENIGKLVASDRDAKHHYNNILYGKDQELVNKLQQSYSSVYKDDIMDTPEKVAKAEAIMRASVPQEEGEDYRPDFQERTKAAINKIYIQDGLIRGRQHGSGSEGTKIEGNEFDRIPIPKKGLFGKGDTVYPNEIPAITKAILKTSGVDIEGMEYFKINTEDGKIKSITPYWKDTNGKIHQEGVITRTDMENAQLKYNAEPQKGQQPVFGDGTSTQSSRIPKDIKKTKMSVKKEKINW